MIQATLSLQGMYEYDNSVLSGFRVPEGIDRNTTIYNLIVATAPFEIVYPNIPILQSRITQWCNMRMPVWEKLYETTQYDYNPIENYNRNEIWHDNRKGTNERKDSTNISTTRENELNQTQTDGGSGSGESAGTNTANDTRQKWGFNSDVPANAEKNIHDGTEKNNSTNEYSNNSSAHQNTNGTETTKHGGSVNDSSTDDAWHSGHMFGNIGVTTTQQMIKEEREIVEFSVMKYIIDDFIHEFCIMVF